jgi:hypothetical protein
VDLDTHIQFVIDAMKTIAAELGLDKATETSGLDQGTETT